MYKLVFSEWASVNWKKACSTNSDLYSSAFVRVDLIWHAPLRVLLLLTITKPINKMFLLIEIKMK